MNRYYFASTFADFAAYHEHEILGALAASAQLEVQPSQRDAWTEEIRVLKQSLAGLSGVVMMEFSIPRMGSRIDVVLIIRHVVFVVEFKVFATDFAASAIDQVFDYALDLHYFHEPSHNCILAPILVATDTKKGMRPGGHAGELLLAPTCTSSFEFRNTIDEILASESGRSIDPDLWCDGRYSPTPTIVEAAIALYRGHSVSEISRNDAGGASLQATSIAVSEIIEMAMAHKKKAICFVTGVPGAGKTLVGLNIANQHTDSTSELYSVFLSGNGPLVMVLQEALARDAVARSTGEGHKTTKKEAHASVKQFVQNVHHFRDACIRDNRPPVEHVALFDEAQRAWNKDQTTKFMAQKKGMREFNRSEPDFLIDCLNRHEDWATVVCLVGGGQEINTGEGGIREWVEALRHYPDWQIHISPELAGAEFNPGDALEIFRSEQRVHENRALHLFASMRAFRAERVSSLVQALLDFDIGAARVAHAACRDQYPIAVTRSLAAGREWLREHARGTERYGVVVSSAAERLKAEGIHVKAPMSPVHWFLEGKEDVRSSYYLEDVATEFHIQGLELDWACITWDADFRCMNRTWQNFDFRGSKWQKINAPSRKQYQKNAYRVLLTRARQGMIIVVPEGDAIDPTRLPQYYDGTFEYLREIGLPVI